ncbi:MAG TPA: DoxX family membrane protein [Verrucomicrobiae bacterium]|jgi:uncharacterized membrane protein|nr:DoxX family membrane protein [Verrucomicrobiae bacterium]
MKSGTRTAWQWAVGLLFVAAGANHFFMPKPYLAMIPPHWPSPRALVEISGVAEMMGGLGVLWTATRRLAAWGLIALLVAVFPANWQVAAHGWPGVDAPPWVLWARLPFQPLFIWWVYRIYLRRTRPPVSNTNPSDAEARAKP